ncbi:hypothetical protein V5O48_001449 [Marasmius crinis-equi]|uniref:Uncharacterized protein n=1 Tax=Marasmius crinis-equi TaxID=585013 RepID=A0ABR3FZ17_9AGAR
MESSLPQDTRSIIKSILIQNASGVGIPCFLYGIHCVLYGAFIVILRKRKTPNYIQYVIATTALFILFTAGIFLSSVASVHSSLLYLESSSHIPVGYGIAKLSPGLV